MRETTLTIPELGMVAGTRAALGAGLGLLLGDYLTPGGRKVLGWALVLVGAATTIPLAIDVLGKSRPGVPDRWAEHNLNPSRV